MPRISFVPDDRSVEVREDTTILQAALAAGLPHAHVCGGYARCSTCRVHVVGGLEFCNPRTQRESTIAARLKCGPEIRLACQTTVNGDVEVRRLVLDPDDVALTDLRKRRSGPRRVGEEQPVAVLFADIRGFTAFAETHLPYDVIHILRRLFREMSDVVYANRGTVTTFMGDGFMALFGLENADHAADDALRAGLAILEVADAAEEWLEDLVGQTLEINVGIHYGEAVVGTIRDTESHNIVTAIGDTVNVASRIEAANKITGTRLLVSQDVVAQVGDSAEIGGTFRVPLPGKAGDHALSEVVGWRGEPPVRPSSIAASAGRETRRYVTVAALGILAVAVLIVLLLVVR